MRSPEEGPEEELQRTTHEERVGEVQRTSAGGIDDGPMQRTSFSEPEPQQGAVEVPPAPSGTAPTAEPAPQVPSTFGAEDLSVDAPEGLDELDVLARAEVAAEGERAPAEGAAEGPAAADDAGGGGEAAVAADDVAGDEEGAEAGEAVQRSLAQGASVATAPSIDLESLRTPSGGEPLPSSIRRRVEPVLGADLSHVRVHRGRDAAEKAAAINARAFTLGRHIWLGAGASASDTRLMAHELTHVVQQHAAPPRSRGPPPRTRSTQPPSDQRSDDAARRQVAVRERGPGSVVRGGFFSDAADWVGGKVSDAADWVRERADDVLGYLKEKVAEFADRLPGYRVLSFVLGRNPITAERVERTGTTLLWALAPILPEAMVEQLRQSGAADDVVGAISEATSTLLSAVGSITELLQRSWDAVSIRSSLSENWRRIKGVWAPVFRAVRRFVVTVGKAVLRFVFEAAVSVAGSAGQAVLNVVRKVGSSIMTIVAHPGRFLSNLVGAVVGGFRRFFHNIGGHLRDGFFSWLTGAMDSAGITLPDRWNLRGIAFLGMQLIGLTWANVRRRLVRQLKPNGERKVSLLEKAVDVARRIVAGGLPAVIGMVRERIAGLVDQLRDAVLQFVSIAVAKEAARYVAGLFSGGVGLLLQLARKIYDVVAWVVENFQRMLALVHTIGDALSDIVRGNLAPAAAAVERTLASFIPMLISMFARLVGLGDLPTKIRGIVRKLSAPVNRAIDWVVRKVLTLGRSILARARSAAARAIGWFRRRLPFGRGRFRHTMVWSGSPKAPQLMVRSTETPFDTWLAEQLPEGTALPPAADQLVQRVRDGRKALDKEVADAARDPADDGEGVRRRQEQLHGELERLTAYLQAAATTPESVVEYGPTHHISVGDGSAPVATAMTAAPLTVAGPSGSAVRNPSVLWDALRRRPEGGRTFWIQGHMLNNNLHGPGDDARNLTPISQTANQSHERQVESKVKDTVMTPRGRGDTQVWPVVHYEVTAVYGGTRQLPSATETATDDVRATLRAEAQLATGLTCSAFPMEPLPDGTGWKEDRTRPIVPPVTILNDNPMTVFEAGERDAAAAPWYLTDPDNGSRIEAAAGVPGEAVSPEVQAAVRRAAARVRTWAAFEQALVGELAAGDTSAGAVPEGRRDAVAAAIRVALEGDRGARLYRAA